MERAWGWALVRPPPSFTHGPFALRYVVGRPRTGARLRGRESHDATVVLYGYRRDAPVPVPRHAYGTYTNTT